MCFISFSEMKKAYLIFLIIPVIIVICYSISKVPFNERITDLKFRFDNNWIHVLNSNMSWTQLKNNPTKGFYYETSPAQIETKKSVAKNLGIPFQGSLTNITEWYPGGYEVKKVGWEYIDDNARHGARVYFDLQSRKIWMFWSTLENGLLITVYG